LSSEARQRSSRWRERCRAGRACRRGRSVQVSFTTTPSTCLPVLSVQPLSSKLKSDFSRFLRASLAQDPEPKARTSSRPPLAPPSLLQLSTSPPPPPLPLPPPPQLQPLATPHPPPSPLPIRSTTAARPNNPRRTLPIDSLPPAPFLHSPCGRPTLPLRPRLPRAARRPRIVGSRHRRCRRCILPIATPSSLLTTPKERVAWRVEGYQVLEW
jgi:hypothetical protein